MTREELREHVLRLVQRDLELPCRRAHTSAKYGDTPAVRVFVPGGEYLILVGKFLPHATDPLAPAPGETDGGRECTAAECAQLDRWETW